MSASLRLDRLTKSTKHLSFISSPGNIGDLAYSKTLFPRKTPIHSKQRNFAPPKTPSAITPAFTLKAVPKVLLARHADGTFEFGNLLKRFEEYSSESVDKGHSVQSNNMKMSVQFICMKMLGGACVRSRLKNKIKNALGIVLTKDSGAQASTSTLHGQLRPLYDWTYVFIPTPELYLLPSTELIELVRKALKEVNRKANATSTPIINMFMRKEPIATAHDINALKVEEGEEREVEPQFNRRVWVHDAWDDVQEALNAEGILSPNISNLPTWAQPDFAFPREMPSSPPSSNEEAFRRDSTHFTRRIFRSAPILKPQVLQPRRSER
ncbi:hypothetical protein SCHPADRAFT_909110 [Schizopora paradoxa]|uniref:Uncharacterized protein n=1 Tax=Schizopora paradoxa TaxID=27342 RepID=A0A0H2RSI7_9AGAM|nr:hypothetical protein SCHPADRAFT_909110 [Schizopora paradoxa]